MEIITVFNPPLEDFLFNVSYLSLNGKISYYYSARAGNWFFLSKFIKNKRL